MRRGTHRSSPPASRRSLKIDADLQLYAGLDEETIFQLLTFELQVNYDWLFKDPQQGIPAYQKAREAVHDFFEQHPGLPFTPADLMLLYAQNDERDNHLGSALFWLQALNEEERILPFLLRTKFLNKAVELYGDSLPREIHLAFGHQFLNDTREEAFPSAPTVQWRLQQATNIFSRLNNRTGLRSTLQLAFRFGFEQEADRLKALLGQPRWTMEEYIRLGRGMMRADYSNGDKALAFLRTHRVKTLYPEFIRWLIRKHYPHPYVQMAAALLGVPLSDKHKERMLRRELRRSNYFTEEDLMLAEDLALRSSLWEKRLPHLYRRLRDYLVSVSETARAEEAGIKIQAPLTLAELIHIDDSNWNDDRPAMRKNAEDARRLLAKRIHDLVHPPPEGVASRSA